MIFFRSHFAKIANFFCDRLPKLTVFLLSFAEIYDFIARSFSEIQDFLCDHFSNFTMFFCDLFDKICDFFFYALPKFAIFSMIVCRNKQCFPRSITDIRLFAEIRDIHKERLLKFAIFSGIFHEIRDFFRDFCRQSRFYFANILRNLQIFTAFATKFSKFFQNWLTKFHFCEQINENHYLFFANDW